MIATVRNKSNAISSRTSSQHAGGMQVEFDLSDSYFNSPLARQSQRQAHLSARCWVPSVIGTARLNRETFHGRGHGTDDGDGPETTTLCPEDQPGCGIYESTSVFSPRCARDDLRDTRRAKRNERIGICKSYTWNRGLCAVRSPPSPPHFTSGRTFVTHSCGAAPAQGTKR